MADFLKSTTGRRVGLDHKYNLIIRNPETNAEIQVGPGTDSRAKIRVGGVVSLSSTSVASSATDQAATFASYSLPANTLGENGTRVVIRTWGSFTTGSTVNSKSVRVVFGGSTFTTGSTTHTTRDFTLEREVIRTAANAQTIFNRGVIGKSSFDSTVLVNNPVVESFGTDTSVDTDTITISVSATDGSGTAAGVITIRGLMVEVFPPALS